MKKFTTVLRAIKFWALRRSIYSNTLGYLGGVSYAILVAKICQDHPDLDVCDLIYKFFEFYAEWKWVDPIFIKILQKRDKLNINALQVLESISYEVMPIMTPNNNPKNSAYRVCEATYNTIKKELARGRDIMRQLIPNTYKKIQNRTESRANIEEMEEQKNYLSNHESTPKSA